MTPALAPSPIAEAPLVVTALLPSLTVPPERANTPMAPLPLGPAGGPAPGRYGLVGGGNGRSSPGGVETLAGVSERLNDTGASGGAGDRIGVQENLTAGLGESPVASVAPELTYWLASAAGVTPSASTGRPAASVLTPGVEGAAGRTEHRAGAVGGRSVGTCPGRDEDPAGEIHGRLRQRFRRRGCSPAGRDRHPGGVDIPLGAANAQSTGPAGENGRPPKRYPASRHDRTHAPPRRSGP